MKNIFKKTLVMLIAVAVLATSTGMTAFAEVTAKDAGDVTIQVLATSDVHGKFVPYDYAINEESKNGSLAQISTVVNRLRKENSNTILVDVGDTIQGNSSEIFLQDETHAMAAAMNAMKYDVWVTGNHEFNFGIPTLQKIMKQQNAKVLSGNVHKDDKNLAMAAAMNGIKYDVWVARNHELNNSIPAIQKIMKQQSANVLFSNACKDDKNLAAPYTIIEKSGVKIGIIGMVTPNITRWDADNLKGYKVSDPVEETKKVIAEIKDKVDVLIAAEHMSESNEYDVKNSGVEDLTKACPELDLVIAAHEHKGVKGIEHNGVLTVENKSDGQTVIQVNFTLGKK
ncbi:MAG: metallophosphoesterase, partial [Lachnospiraceae bacterium]